MSKLSLPSKVSTPTEYPYYTNPRPLPSKQPAKKKLTEAAKTFRAADDDPDRELLLAAFAAQTAIDWPDLVALVDGSCGSLYEMPVRAVITAVERSLGESRASDELRAALERCRKPLTGMNLDSAGRKLVARIDAMRCATPSRGLELEPVDAWTCAMQDELETMPEAARAAWGGNMLSISLNVWSASFSLPIRL